MRKKEFIHVSFHVENIRSFLLKKNMNCSIHDISIQW